MTTTTTDAHQADAAQLPLPRTLLILTLIVLGATALRFYHLGHLSFWQDEAATWGFSQWPISDLWGDRYNHEPNPPLYYTLQHLWFVFGDSEAAMRSLSAVLGVLSVPLVYGVGAIVGGRAVGLVAAALVATSVVHVEYSQEARTYMLLLDAALLAVLGLVELVRDPVAAARPTPRALLAWLAYVAGNTIALFSHNTAVFLPLLTGLAALVCWWLQARWNWRLLAGWVLSGVAVLVLWGWRVPLVMSQGGTLSEHWHASFPGVGEIAETSLRALGQPYTVIRPVSDLLFVAAGMLGAWRWRREPRKLVPLLFVVVGLPAMLLLASLKVPMFIVRTLIWPIPVVMVLVAAGALWLPRPALRWAAVAVLLGVQLVGLANYYRSHSKYEPWREAVAYILDRAEPGDTIVTSPFFVLYQLEYYLRDVADPPRTIALLFNDPEENPNHPFEVGGTHNPQPARDDAESVRPWDEVKPRDGRLWLLARGGDPTGRRHEVLSEGRIVTDEWIRDKAQVKLYVPVEIDAAAGSTPSPTPAQTEGLP